MKQLSILFTGLCGLLFCQCVAAQTVVIDGELRPRIEMRDGYRKPLTRDYDPGVFALQRTRLSVAFNSPSLKTLITFQDARTFGQNSLTSSDATTGLFEGWAEMSLFSGASFKIGRQILKYDDSRLFTAAGWNNTGSSHDAALFKFAQNGFQAHLGFAYNNNSSISSETYYNPVVNYRYLGYVWMNKGIVKGLNLSLMAIDEGMQDTIGTHAGSAYRKISMYHAYTYGGNLKYESDDCPVGGQLTAYFQSGKTETGKSMTARMICMKADYQFASWLTLTAATDYFSGDKNAADMKQTYFRKLYGADHNFNGYMDYWNTLPSQGLLDYFCMASGRVNKKLDYELTYHRFDTEFRGLNRKNVPFGKKLGSEIDFIFNFQVNQWTVMQMGYSYYFSNSNTLIAKDMVPVPGAIPAIRNPQWAYVMFTIKPVFLTTAISGRK